MVDKKRRVSMKLLKKFLGIAAVIAVIGFITLPLIGCPETEPEHVHKWGEWTVQEPTCTEAGQKTRTCSLDGSHTETQIIAALGHDWGEWGAETSATDTEDGTKNRACSNDGEHTETLSVSSKKLTSIAELTAWLNAVPVNTADTAYKINFSSNYISDIKTTLRSDANKNKYVNLDLSGSTITTIPEYAFSYYTTGYGVTGCTSLTSITIPNSVTSIGKYAFSGCTSLIDITIPNSVTTISERTFDGCTGLTSVTIGSGVTSIGYSAFSSCTSLIDITIPNSVTSIESYAFSNCTSLFDITIPDTVTSIEAAVFRYCTSLTGISIPNSVTSIGNSAFSDTGLTSVIIPDSVTSIESYAFSNNCTSLTSVTFERNDSTTISYAEAFMGDLVTVSGRTGAQNRYGTYTTTAPVSDTSTWTKTP
jgi:hypothetical protein